MFIKDTLSRASFKRFHIFEKNSATKYCDMFISFAMSPYIVKPAAYVLHLVFVSWWMDDWWLLKTLPNGD